MTRFDECLTFILSQEGGYSDHPKDRGGATNKGITQRVYTAFRKKSGLTLRSVKEITDDEVASIYKTGYWIAAKCHLLPAPIDLYTFDAAVQHGPVRAVKLLQRALCVDDDGKIGPKTIGALQEEIKAGQLAELARNLIAIRLDFYDQIIDNDPSQKVFERGWDNRIAHLRIAGAT